MASISRREGRDGVSYKIVVAMGRDAEGNQIRRFMTWRPPHEMTARQAEKEVKRVACDFERAIENGYQADNRQTFSEYARYVIELKKRQGESVNSISIYEAIYKRLSPMIGRMRMNEIRPQHLNRIYAELGAPKRRGPLARAYPKASCLEAMKRRGESKPAFAKVCGVSEDVIRLLRSGEYVSQKSAEKVAACLGQSVSEMFDVDRSERALSPSTIERIHSFISVVFRQAEKEMLVTFNPASRATPPRRAEHTPNYFQPDQLDHIMDAVNTEPIMWKTLFHLMIVSGARRGEVLALKWKNVDFERRQIRIDSSISYTKASGIIDGPTKTRQNRYVPLPAESFDLLRKYRAWQAERRLMLGDLWMPSDYVFTRELGGPLFPTSINARLNRLSSVHGLPHINPHAFRHSAASIMIAHGVDLVSVASMLGHKDSTITAEVYAHAIEESKRGASECIAETILKRKRV